ncbi:MAG: esterase-like activity of phytase family protein [Sphingomonadales bacterium]
MLWRAIALLVLAAVGASQAAAKSPRQDIIPLTITAKPMPLDPTQPKQERVGALLYRGGLELHADSPLFGGLSGLALSPDGDTLVAVSDTGYWFIADLVLDQEGTLIGLENAVMADLLRPDGLAHQGRALSDAEALAIDYRRGVVYVAFENRHRIWAYDFNPYRDMRQLLRTPARAIDDKGALAKQPGNGGVEALCWVEGEGLVALSEEHGDGAGGRAGWLFKSGRPMVLRYDAPLPYVPTDAAALPGGKALILNRQASWLSGFAAKLVLAQMPTFEPGAQISGEVIAEFGGSVISDNFEGIAAWQDRDGDIAVYMVSDDNYNPLQRNLLLKFLLKPETDQFQKLVGPPAKLFR